MLQLHLGQWGRDPPQRAPALFTSRPEVHWLVLFYIHCVIQVAFPSSRALSVRRVWCLTSRSGWQFTDEIHNLWLALIFWRICQVLSHILEGHHDFWILSDGKNLWVTENFPGPRRCCRTRHSSRKVTWKRAVLCSWLSGFFPPGSLKFFQSLLNPSILSLISCSSRFSSHLLRCSATFWALSWTSFSIALASSS